MTTSLHLVISLATVLLAIIAATSGLKLLAPRRLSGNASYSLFIRSITAGLESLAGQANRPETVSLRRQIRLRITPLSLSCALAAVLAALVEMQASRVTETRFWSTARLLPLLLVVILSAKTSIVPSSTKRDAGQVVMAALLFIVFLAGPATRLAASSQGWLAGIGYTGAVTSWVICIQVDKRERDRETKSVLCPSLSRSCSYDATANRIASSRISRCLRYSSSFRWSSRPKSEQHFVLDISDSSRKSVSGRRKSSWPGADWLDSLYSGIWSR